MSEHIKATTDAGFEGEVLQSKLPALVDFWAEWCGPCRMIAPVLAEIATIYAGKVNVFKLNVDENNETPAKYGVRSIPTLILYKDGAVEATKIGAMTKAQLAEFLDKHI